MFRAANAIAGNAGGNGGRRLATPGALLMLGGLVLMYWGLGILRGETGRNYTRQWFNPGDFGKTPPATDEQTRGGAGGQKVS